MEADQTSMKLEIEGQLRREWELKARLEIDRQVQIELETLRNKFEREVDQKVQAALAKQSRHAAREGQQQHGKKETTSFDSSSYNTAGEEGLSFDNRPYGPFRAIVGVASEFDHQASAQEDEDSICEIEDDLRLTCRYPNVRTVTHIHIRTGTVSSSQRCSAGDGQ